MATGKYLPATRRALAAFLGPSGDIWWIDVRQTTRAGVCWHPRLTKILLIARGKPEAAGIDSNRRQAWAWEAVSTFKCRAKLSFLRCSMAQAKLGNALRIFAMLAGPRRSSGDGRGLSCRLDIAAATARTMLIRAVITAKRVLMASLRMRRHPFPGGLLIILRPHLEGPPMLSQNQDIEPAA